MLARPQLAAAEPLPGLEAFVDGVVAGIATQRIAGAQIAVVKDGEVLLTKGYGIAGLDPERPVDPQRSLFRLGSISKLFTWLSLVQLEERGKLRLSDPVNQHLPRELAIPDDGWREPVRILDLMNHTAGFEDSSSQEDDVSGEAQLLTLQQHLARFRPRRVRKRGTLSVYSNYGAQLAGAIIAHESGLDFESYVERHVLAPLGMEHTTFREVYGPKAPRGLPAPMPDVLARERAVGIDRVAGAWKVQPYEHRPWAAPRGSVVSTAADMARFMIALLDPARLEQAGVLTRTSFHRVAEPSFRPAPGLRALHHGFFDATGTRSVLGYANLSHSGFLSLSHFASQMLVFPELGLGTFVTTNSAVGGQLASVLHELILKRYFPRPERAPPLATKVDLGEYAGQYRAMRRNYTQLEAVFELDDVSKIDVGEGYLLVRGRPDETARYARIGRDLFENTSSDSRLAFLRDSSGKIVGVVGAITADRVPFYETALWFRAWMLAGLVAALASVRQAFRRRHAPKPRSERYLMLTAAVWLVFYMVATVWQFRYGFGDALEGYPQLTLKLAVLLLMAAAACTLPAVLMLVPLWRNPSIPRGRRAWHTLTVACWIGATLAAQQWNVLGIHYY
jgi:CubicO group peptidase (beta-lactamase class C family)